MRLFFLLIALMLFSTGYSWCYISKFSVDDQVYEVDYSPDGTKIVVAQKSDRVEIYDAYTYAFLGDYDTGKVCFSAKFSKDGSMIAIGMQSSSRLVIISGVNYNWIRNISTNLTSIYEVDFSYDDSKIIACGSMSGNEGYQIYNPNGAFIHKQQIYSDKGLSCRFATNNAYAVGVKDGQVYTYLANYNPNWNYNASGGQVLRVEFSEDATYLLTGDTGNRVRRYLLGGTVTNSSYNTGQKVMGLDYAPDTSYHAHGGDNKDVFIYDGTYATMSTKLFTFTQPDDDIRSVRFNRASEYLAAGCKDKNVYIYKRHCDCPVQYYWVSKSCRFCALDMVGCRLCNTNNICLLCTDRYYLNTNSLCATCISAIPACEMCISSTVCTHCSITYYRDATNKCTLCWKTMPGCIQCDSSTVCLLCSFSKYYLSSGTCIACTSLPNCLTCINSTVCSNCASGYYLNGNQCVRCPNNCSLCTSATNCTECDNGYYYSSFSCLSCPTNCFSCTAAACLTCNVGFYISLGTCLTCVSPCASCTSASYCNTCIHNWFSSSAGVCTKCGSNCATCSSSIACTSCLQGYYYISSSQLCQNCTSLTSNCEACSNITCFLCSSGYYLGAGNICASCSSEISGCSVCSTGATCVICQTQFYLSGNICLLCNWPCLTCSNSTGCTACPIGFYVNGSSLCSTCSAPCLSCFSNSNCSSCSIGYYRNGGSCVLCSTAIQNCTACLSSTICLSCMSNYYWNSPFCVSCSGNCSTCTSATLCLNCALGYYKSGTLCLSCSEPCSLCNSSTSCIQCVVGYYLSGVSCSKCSLISAGCVKCTAIICQQCEYSQGYYLSSTTTCSLCSSVMNACVRCVGPLICTSCSVSYTLATNNTCISCGQFMPNCQVCESTSLCNLCLEGYYPSAASCLTCSFGCDQCISGTICKKCFGGLYLQANGSCSTCTSLIVGCEVCSSPSICTSCQFGYYLSGVSCFSCSSVLANCYECPNATVCTICFAGSYLQSNICKSCSSLQQGCVICNQTLPSKCLFCDQGYFLNLGSCNLCLDSNCQICSNSTSCQTCKSGFYLTNNNCMLCSGHFLGCIFCSATQCYRCQSGYSLNNITFRCQPCSAIGCEICKASSSQCLACNDHYYLTASNVCLPCNNSISLAFCKTCSSSTSCFQCLKGYYINGSSQCVTCMLAFPHCQTCISTTCYECQGGYLLNGGVCSFCGGFIEGCAFCKSSSLCLNCQQGYYLNGNACNSCSNITGCLICFNSNKCYKCDSGYFLSGNTCSPCSTTMNACINCVSNTICTACLGEYVLSNSGCQQATNSEIFYPYSELKFYTEYVERDILKHTLWVKGSNFNQSSIDLILTTNISYLSVGGFVTYLTITSFQWGTNGKTILFFTNNPFNLEQGSDSVSKMSLFNKRFLQANNNLELDVNFQIMMSSSAISIILPSSKHSGSLFLSYNINNPEFVASLQRNTEYQYYLFGLVTTILMVLFYFATEVVFQGRYNGRIIPHVLYSKMAALIIFPSYFEMINYCSGFMIADLPWLNNYSGILSDWTQQIPFSYSIFYNSMNLASTYLLPTVTLFILAIILGLLSCITSCKKISSALSSFLYNVFIAGATVATTMNFIGAIYNAIITFSINGAVYIFGIIIFFIIITHSIYKIFASRQQTYKIRAIIKGIILAAIYQSPIYLFMLVLLSESIFMYLEYRFDSSVSSKGLWLCSNILINISLLLLIQFSHSLLSIYIGSCLIAISIIFQIIITIRQLRLKSLINQFEIKIQNSLKGLNETQNSIPIDEFNIEFEQKKQTRKAELEKVAEDIKQQSAYQDAHKRSGKKRGKNHNTFVLADL